jgi:flagellar protein FliS
MLTTAHEAYLESRIESGGPLQLVRLLYQEAISTVRDARRLLAARDIAGRSRAISKAYRIVAELTASLDRDRGGEIAFRLAQLYDYMMRRLTDANLTQSDELLVEVLGLLSTLNEAWQQVEEQGAVAAPPPARPWEQVPAEDAVAAGHAWTL